MLKVAVLSDTHLGFAYGTERQEDSFKNLEQAFRLIIKEEPQPNLVLLCGDIFHDKIPRQEVLGRAIELFSQLNKSIRSKPQLLKRVKDKKEEVVKELIPPIVAIWGTHERRHSGSTNPIQILEKAGLLYCLHAESILVECGYDKIGVHGLSGVPEQYSKDAMKAWEPKPFTEAQHNVLLIHQNIKELMPPVDYALSLADFPKDFIVFSGHIHNTTQNSHPVSKKPFIVVGSTVSTQLQKIESETPKGFYIAEFGRERYDMKFVPIRTRPFFYKKLDVRNKRPAEMLYEVDQTIGKILKENLLVESEKPIIRIKLEGTLAENFRPEDLDFSKVMKDFGDRVILSLDKSNLQSIAAESHSTLLEELKSKKVSVEQIGLEILSKNLKLNVDAEKLSTIFHLLSEGEIEQAESAIEGNYEPKLEAKADYISQSAPIIAPSPIIEYPKTQVAGEEPLFKPATEIRQESKLEVEEAPQHQVAPQAAPVRHTKGPDPETERLAETGLSMLGTGSKVPSRPAAPRPVAVAAAVPAAPRQSTAPVETTRLAESGLSKLASSEKKAAPTIRLKESPQSAPIAKAVGPAAKNAIPAPALRRRRDDDVIEIKKGAFDLKKWLNKG